MVFQKTGDDFFLERLDDFAIRLAVDEHEESEFAVNFRDVTFENELGENGADVRFLADFVEQLAEGDAHAELDGVEMAGLKLTVAVARKIDLRVVGNDPVFFEFLAFAVDGSRADAGGFRDGGIGLARVADKLTDDERFLFVERFHGEKRD